MKNIIIILLAIGFVLFLQVPANAGLINFDKMLTGSYPSTGSSDDTAVVLTSLKSSDYSFSPEGDDDPDGDDSGSTPDSFLLTNFSVGNETDNSQLPPPVPEPATMLLVGTGLIGLAGAGKRLRKG